MADGQKKSKGPIVVVIAAAASSAGALYYAYTQGWLDFLIARQNNNIQSLLTVRVLKVDETPIAGAGVNVGATSDTTSPTYQNTDANGEVNYVMPYGTHSISIVSNLGNKTEIVTLTAPTHTLVSQINEVPPPPTCAPPCVPPATCQDVAGVPTCVGGVVPGPEECVVSGMITRYGGIGLVGARLMLYPGDYTLDSDAAGLLPATLVPQGAYTYALRLAGYIDKSGTVDCTGDAAVIALEMTAVAPAPECASAVDCPPERPFCNNGVCVGEHDGQYHVSGVVRDEILDVPVAYVNIDFTNPITGEVFASVIADASGAYDMLLPPGMYGYKAYKLDLINPYTSTVPIVVGSTDVALDILVHVIAGNEGLCEVPATIWTRVKTAAGVGIPGVTVEVVLWRHAGKVPTGQTAVTGADGTVGIVYYPTSGDAVEVWAYIGDNFLGNSTDANGIPISCGMQYPEGGVGYVEITADTTGLPVVVSGIVGEFGTGTPLRNAAVEFKDAAGVTKTVYTSDDGSYTATVAASTIYTVTFSKEGYITKVYTGQSFAGNYGWNEALVPITTDCLLTVRVLRADGTPINGAGVAISGMAWSYTNTNSNGETTYTLPYGTYDVVIIAYDVQWTRTVTLAAPTYLLITDGTEGAPPPPPAPALGYVRITVKNNGALVAASTITSESIDGIAQVIGGNPNTITGVPLGLHTVAAVWGGQTKTVTVQVVEYFNDADVAVVNFDFITAALRTLTVTVKEEINYNNIIATVALRVNGVAWGTKTGSVVSWTDIPDGATAVVAASKSGYDAGTGNPATVVMNSNKAVTLLIIPSGMSTCTACGFPLVVGRCYNGECMR